MQLEPIRIRVADLASRRTCRAGVDSPGQEIAGLFDSAIEALVERTCSTAERMRRQLQVLSLSLRLSLYRSFRRAFCVAQAEEASLLLLDAYLAARGLGGFHSVAKARKHCTPYPSADRRARAQLSRKERESCFVAALFSTLRMPDGGMRELNELSIDEIELLGQRLVSRAFERALAREVHPRTPFLAFAETGVESLSLLTNVGQAIEDRELLDAVERVRGELDEDPAALASLDFLLGKGARPALAERYQVTEAAVRSAEARARQAARRRLRSFKP